ncbi:MAG: PKD domain-containing protein [Alphaproteobacteria bacterium]|nr:PKD domain-containing protein [Alphaproteobacteria bacterium]
MKKFLSLFCVLSFFLCGQGAWAASTDDYQVANIEFIHEYIKQKHKVDVKIANPAEKHWAANVKYMLCAVDVANRILNGFSTTNYCNHTLATPEAINKVGVIQAVDGLIKKLCDDGFCVIFDLSTDWPVQKTFSFQISAQGSFTIDWGDGTVETKNRTGTTLDAYSHSYSAAGTYIVKLTGLATGYNSNNSTAAISFANTLNKTKMTRIVGSLGRIFPILDNPVAGTFHTPRFVSTFSGSWISNIPADLFDGINGPPVDSMFSGTFYNCQFLIGPIPENLFAGIRGAPKNSLFATTFYYCRRLTGPIPENLFAGIYGAPAGNMFVATFGGCLRLTGKIPGNLFHGPNHFDGVGISGAPQHSMFRSTFYECTDLTGIGEGLFDGISGVAQSQMFNWTFDKSSSLTGPSATSDGQYLYQKWPSTLASGMVPSEGQNCYRGATKLDDYCGGPNNPTSTPPCIPLEWR